MEELSQPLSSSDRVSHGPGPTQTSTQLLLQTLCHSAVTEPGHRGMGYSKEETLVQKVEVGEAKVRKPPTRC